jgi:intein/homing endonuclease
MKSKCDVAVIALDTIAKGKQALVFVNSKNSAEKQADDISAEISEKDGRLSAIADDILSALPVPTRQCRRLSACIEKGIAFHHSGLSAKQREIVENSFRDGKIKIICATPTLAAGVDLPAFRAVLKTLKRYGRRGMEYISVIEFMQMCLPYEELIMTDKGRIPIGKLVEEKIDCEVLSFNVKKQVGEFKPIEGYYKTSSKQFIEIKTHWGYTLKLTPEHPVFVKDHWKNASGLKKNDELKLSLMRCPFAMPSPSLFDFVKEEQVYFQGKGGLIEKAKSRLGVAYKDLAEKICLNRKSIKKYIDNKKSLSSSALKKILEILEKEFDNEHFLEAKTAYGSFLSLKKIDEDFMWLVGIIATDGNIQRTVDKRTKSEYIKIRVFNKNKKIIDKAKFVLEQYIQGNACVSLRNDGLYSCEIGSTLLAKVLRKHFGVPFKNKTYKIRAPQFLFDSSQELIGAYLAGVFDGDGCYTSNLHKHFKNSAAHRVLFTTASKKFSDDIHKLLLILGIPSNKYGEKLSNKVILKKKEVYFGNTQYYVVFNKKKYISRFAEFAKPIKCNFDVSYSDYHNLNKKYDSEDLFIPLKVVKKRAISSSEFVKTYNLKIKDNENYFASNILVHNCGRAGRPKYDTEGEAICIASSENEKNELVEMYLRGEPESVYSKLAAEPALRVYILSLVASGFVRTEHELIKFFEKTFFAHQYKDIARLNAIIVKVVEMLKDWKMIKGSSDDFVSADALNKNYEATFLGKRAAELYIDPLTADHLAKGLGKEKNKTVFSYLQLVSHTLEMRPLLSVKSKEYEEIQEKISLNENDFLDDGFFSDDFEESVKTAWFFEEWINEKDEDYLLEKFNVRPGEVKYKLDSADWLLFSCEELCKILLLHDRMRDIAKLRLRLHYGVKEELLPLVKIRQIGKVRARKLFNAGISNAGDLKKADISALKRILGEKLGDEIKKELEKG